MNVIISNKYESLLATLDIDVIKSLNGVFTVDEIVSTFTNFYYNKMILDITAIQDYQNIATIQELSVNMDMSKIVILLDDSEVVNSPRYLSQLVSMGVYNFTRNIDAVRFLIDNPNTYKDVAQYHQLNDVGAFEPIASSSHTKDDHEESSSSGSVAMRVIGVKNVTEHAGSTTLTYLLKKQLASKYDVIAVEVDNNDFIYFNDKSLHHTTSDDLSTFIVSHSNHEVILVDLNKGSVGDCNEVIYLIEPGLIKLNKLIRQDRKAFEKLKDKKIILNRSVLNSQDVSDFEYESRSKVYFNIPYLDDKLDHHHILDEFLIKMGFVRLEHDTEEKGNKLFNIFK